MNQVLVLNASFEPVRIVDWQKAMQLLFQGKVEVLEEYDREIRTVRFSFRLPSVLRLLRYVPFSKKRNMVRFSRNNILMRDQHTCQYCGRKRNKNELTLDHVTPVVQGGKKTWDNIVAACIQCNQKKGGRTPHEAGMGLINKPSYPKLLPEAIEWSVTISTSSAPAQWKVYFTFELPWQTTPKPRSTKKP
jgi:5-methylcytosine-specific restriction endonuclease McrA